MIAIQICGLSSIDRFSRPPPDYMITILAENINLEEIRPLGMEPSAHFAFYFSDVADPDHPHCPQKADIARLVELGKHLTAGDTSRRILIHCAAGVSRSTAAAYILYCIDLGEGHEKAALDHTIASAESPFIWPNDLMVNLADEILDRHGAMVSTLSEWKRRWMRDNM